MGLVYRHPNEHALVWLYPPTDVNLPNRMMCFWTTYLEDNTIVTSQAFDPFFACMATEKMPAKTINGHTFAEQWSQHMEHVQTTNASPDAASTSEEAILNLVNQSSNDRYSSLLAQGMLRKDTQGIVRPKIRFALRLLWNLWRRPHCKDVKANHEVPLSRLLWLSRVIDNTLRFSPSKRAQGSLFGVSLLLFMVIGAVFWNLQIAILLLAVIIFHELGHYLAMRAFGFSNVHMMALPLLGGVTVGYNVKPRAIKNAWMSLMGPIPGILLGWALLVWVIGYGDEGQLSQWLEITAFVLLLINYLNLLPVLPLDGGHVIQALLPPRWVIIQGMFILVLCTTGVIMALWFEFYLLALLAGFQLLTLGATLQTAKVVRELVAIGVPDKSLTNTARLKPVLNIFEKLVGPCTNARERIHSAKNILTLVDTQPMTAYQRSQIIAVLVVLGAIPFMLLPIGSYLAGDVFVDKVADRVASAYLDGKGSMNDFSQFKSMSNEEIMRDIMTLSNSDLIPLQANIAEIKSVEKNLDIHLPGELFNFYLAYNGLDAINIKPVGEIRKITDQQLTTIEQQMQSDCLNIFISEQREEFIHCISLEEIKQWIYIGHNKAFEQDLYIAPNDENINFIVYVAYGEAYTQPTLRSHLQSEWYYLKFSE